MNGQPDRPLADDPEGASRRSLVTALLVGGLLLVLLTQQSYGSLVGLRRGLAVALLLLGLGSFMLAVTLIARLGLPGWLARPIARGQRFFGVSSGQLALLLYGPCFALLAGLAAGESLLALNLPLSLIAYGIGLAAVLAGSYRPQAGSHDGLDRWDALVVGALLVLALLLRAVNLESLPPTLSGDEGSAGLQAVGFVEGKANNPFVVGWFSFPSLFFVLQGAGILLLGQSAAGLRLISVLGGALTVAAVYWLARTLFGRLIAVTAAFLLAVFHYHIHFSRLGLNNIWDGFFAVLVLAGVAYGWQSNRRLGFLIAGLALGLGQYFYVSFRAMPVLLLIWVILAFFADRERLRRRLPDLMLLALVALTVALPLQLFFVSHPDEFLAPMRRVTVFDGWLRQVAEVEGQPQLVILIRQAARTAMGITHLPLRHWYNPGSPLLLAGPAGLFLLGLLWLLLRPRLLHWLLLLPIAALIILGGLSQDAPASQRYVLAAPLVVVVAAIPLAVAAQWLWRAWPRFRPLTAIAVALAVAWLAWGDLGYYFHEVFDAYVLGGRNTEVATAVARYLDDLDPPPEVYFFGQPRMGYYSLSTIPYLVPQVTAEDVAEPLRASPNWRLTSPAVFLFLPERQEELVFIESLYPGGAAHRMLDETGELLFVAYETPGQSPAR